MDISNSLKMAVFNDDGTNEYVNMMEAKSEEADQHYPENTDKLHRFETIHITGFSTKVIIIVTGKG